MSAIPFSEYIEIEATNWSSLKHLRESPLAYRYHKDHEDKDTTGRMLGRILHALVFEPQTFESAFAVFEGETRRGKEWEAFKAANADRAIVKSNELDGVREQAAAVRNHPLLAPYLDGGQFEKTLQWTDKETGLACKGRIDWWHKPTRTLIDLKGATTVHEERFGRIAAQQGYPMQLAHYVAGIEAMAGFSPTKVAIVAVENKPPYDVGFFTLPPAMLDAARIGVQELLHTLAGCLASGKWPGRYTSESQLWEFNSEPNIAFEEEAA